MTVDSPMKNVKSRAATLDKLVNKIVGTIHPQLDANGSLLQDVVLVKVPVVTTLVGISASFRTFYVNMQPTAATLLHATEPLHNVQCRNLKLSLLHAMMVHKFAKLVNAVAPFVSSMDWMNAFCQVQIRTWIKESSVTSPVSTQAKDVAQHLNSNYRVFLAD